jgi:hypothetical protein
VIPLPPAPVLLLGQGYQLRDRLAPIGAARVSAGMQPPGLLLSWAHVHEEGVREGAANAYPLQPVLADPGARGFERNTIGRTKAAAPWIRRRAPRDPTSWDQSMDEAVSAQHALHLPGVLLPSRTLRTTDWPDGVQDALDAVRRASSRHTGSNIFAGLILEEPWVTDAQLRRTLLNQFTDLPLQVGAAIHVLWSDSSASSAPRRLAAMRTVVAALANDGRRVLLIESGGLGWLSLAWGAWGFTAGLSQASWLRSTETVRRARGQPAVFVPRYYEAGLLHRVRQATHQRLAREPGYRACACAFCVELRPTTASLWDHRLAEQHALWALADLTERVAAPRLVDRHARVRAMVDSAIALERGLSFRLMRDSRPEHLPAWRAEL